MRIHFLLLAAAASQLGATDCGEVLRDPGFDLWCGEKLCTWKIVRGDARRVDTWHEGDSGVELLGPDAAIAQLSPVNYRDGTCIRFDLVANVSEGAEARLGIDVYGDGSIEINERIHTSSWEPLTFKLRIAKPFSGVRFELSKKGPGKAEFANIGARIDRECDGITEVSAGPAPLGALCIEDAHCESAMCRTSPDPGGAFGYDKRCVACEPMTCSANQACGIAEPISPVLGVPIKCVAAGGDELGEQCASNAECASGICTGFACSACGDANPCAAGETCGPAWANGPHVCGAGAALRRTGEPCGTNADCASDACNGGERKACEDNRPCGNDNNCPVTGGLIPGACTTVGVQGGSCS